MNRTLTLAIAGLALGLAACSGDDEEVDAGTPDSGVKTDGGVVTCDYDTDAKVLAFLEGKTMTMYGAGIPTHPNGFLRDTNFGAATQCVFATELSVVNEQISVKTTFAELTGAPNQGDTGTCDVNTRANLPLFETTSTAVLVENTTTDCGCFDVTITYPGFVQEGRARIAEDGTTVDMELYFQGQATGHRCADGNPGDATVILNGADFTGDAVQTYNVGETTPECMYKVDSDVTDFLEGKTLLMNGENIPTHPNGFLRDQNLGAASQCISETQIDVASGNFAVTTTLGTLSGAPNQGDIGTCDVNTPFGTPLEFNSTSVLVENTADDCSCFDITVTFAGFAQEGRARISPNGSAVDMELFFSGQATGHRCADGALGASGVMLNGAAFDGDAVQTYVIQ